MARPSTDPEKHRAATPQSEHQPAPTSVQPTGKPGQAAEDAKDTLTTSDSRQKSALELNVEGGQGQRHPDIPPGQHATGSFTDEP